jgi:hypothetical protein
MSLFNIHNNTAITTSLVTAGSSHSNSAPEREELSPEKAMAAATAVTPVTKTPKTPKERKRKHPQAAADPKAAKKINDYFALAAEPASPVRQPGYNNVAFPASPVSIQRDSDFCRMMYSFVLDDNLTVFKLS